MTPNPEMKMRRYRVMIVDDHPIVRHGLIKLIAQESDLEVCGEAADAGAARRLAEELRPDAIIVDISLEGESGIELIEQVKAAHPEIKMLVSSIHDETVYAPRVLRAGAVGYISKRESIRKIVDALRKVLLGEIYLSPRMANRLLHRVAVGEPLDRNPIEILSNRELEVFQMIGQGLTTQHIARRLGLSPKTVETHRKKIKIKLDLKNSAELSRCAFQWAQENL